MTRARNPVLGRIFASAAETAVSYTGSDPGGNDNGMTSDLREPPSGPCVFGLWDGIGICCWVAVAVAGADTVTVAGGCGDGETACSLALPHPVKSAARGMIVRWMMCMAAQLFMFAGRRRLLRVSRWMLRDSIPGLQWKGTRSVVDLHCGGAPRLARLVLSPDSRTISRIAQG